MTTDSTQPQAETGPATDNGQEQSQGHRRRRRRRKNKPTQQGTPQVQQAQAPAQPQQQSAPPRPPHAHQNQGHKKKKFFQKGSAAQTAQPGNSISGTPQSKQRKGRQKGPREFVGPMDHSYRAVNGNVSDGPPSTIQFMNSNQSAYQPEAFVPQVAVPVREDAPTRIFCFIDDLFFQAKIHETARKLGVKVEFVKGDKESVARLLDLKDGNKPALLIFDLNNLNAKPMTLIPKFKTKFKKTVSVVGFLGHLQGDLRTKAVEVGCDSVMPRSAFSQTLPNLLRRYGLEEEEEYDQQPV
jgi:hypothetical protein